jgi:hypothetical protein
VADAFMSRLSIGNTNTREQKRHSTYPFTILCTALAGQISKRSGCAVENGTSMWSGKGAREYSTVTQIAVLHQLPVAPIET